MSDVDWPRPRPESTCGANSARRFTAQRVDGGRSGAIVLSRSKTASASWGRPRCRALATAAARA